MKQPIQPLYQDERGVVRFRENKIVRYLLDNGGIDLNHLARLEFSEDDREQFAQLIGYSLSGFSELSYVSDETFAAAGKMFAEGETAEQGRIKALEEVLAQVREGLKAATVAAFKIHPDDLEF